MLIHVNLKITGAGGLLAANAAVVALEKGRALVLSKVKNKNLRRKVHFLKQKLVQSLNIRNGVVAEALVEKKYKFALKSTEIKVFSDVHFVKETKAYLNKLLVG